MSSLTARHFILEVTQDILVDQCTKREMEIEEVIVVLFQAAENRRYLLRSAEKLPIPPGIENPYQMLEVADLIKAEDYAFSTECLDQKQLVKATEKAILSIFLLVAESISETEEIDSV